MAVVKQFKSKDILFKSESDWAKLCYHNRVSDSLATWERITNKKTGFASHVELKKDNVANKPMKWFSEQSEIYSGIKRGKKNRAVVIFVDETPWFFANRANWGKLCTLIRFDNDITYLYSTKVMEQLAEKLELDENGNLVSEDITTWKQLNFDAEYRRIKKIEGLAKLRDIKDETINSDTTETTSDDETEAKVS